MRLIYLKLMNYGGHFDFDNKQVKLQELSAVMNKPDFWNDKRQSEKVINEFNSLNGLLTKIKDLKEEVEFHYLSLKDSNLADDVISFALEEMPLIKSKLKELEMQILLNGKYDKDNAVLEIHSGAGGTEACDWVEMLYRMYSRWCEKKGYKLEVIDEQPGTEAGLKSIVVIVKGHNAFGYLKVKKEFIGWCEFHLLIVIRADILLLLVWMLLRLLMMM